MKRTSRVICLLLAITAVGGLFGCVDPAQPDTATTDTATTDAATTDRPAVESETPESESTDGETTADGDVQEEVPPLTEIQYEMSQNPREVTERVSLRLPAAEEAVTGNQLAAYMTLTRTVGEYIYYVVDWGDGTWSYNGPYQYSDSTRHTGEVYHTYKKAGTYEVKGCAVNLSTGGMYGWTQAQTLTVTGEDYTGTMIQNVTPIALTTEGEGYEVQNIIDGDNTTRWQSAKSDWESEDYVGLLFDGHYTLDSLEIKFPADSEGFPCDISVEYTTDGGETWYMLPHYYYVLPNSEGYYSFKMKFPNPLGATLVLPMEGICANGVRLRSKTYFRGTKRYFGVEEMRVYGEKGTLFYTSYEGYYGADLSNMWTIYGLAKTEPLPWTDEFRSGALSMGGSVEWLAWDSTQLVWTGYEGAARHIQSMKDAMYGGDGWYYDEATGTYVVDTSEYNSNPRNDGYIWATESAPQHLGAQNHYTNNASLIIAARNYLLQGNDTEEFLAAQNSRGQVMLDKLRKAMEYMLVNLNGQSGLMTIYDPRNDGTVRGMSSNYWDSLNFFGYNSAYENIFFYQSVLAMADIESYIGNTEAAEEYVALAQKIKTTFNDYFWDAQKGRYLTSVNIKGDVLDFGVTFVNFMAVAAGLASEEQAQLIYDWVDGKRIIEGDTSTGEDIYAFAVSARTNTVAIEPVEEDGLHYWWYNGHAFADVLPGHWGVYGQQMQNGGTIFYTSHYDVAGRAFLSGDLAMERFNTIMEEFHKDSLRRDPRTKWGFYQVSINGEFPESGLVPATFVTDILGITAEVEGLKIESHLPSDMTYAGINEYHYGNRVYRIEVNKSLTQAEMTEEGGVYTVKIPADQIYYLTAQNQLIPASDPR